MRPGPIYLFGKFKSFEVGAPSLLSDHLPGNIQHAGRIAPPPKLHKDPSSLPQAPPDPRQNRPVIQDPVKSSEREDEIKLVMVLQVSGITVLEVEVWPLFCREPGPGKAQHLQGAIKPHH